MVRGGKTIVTGDESPDTPTEVIYEQEKYCSNPICENHNKTVDIVKHKMN